MSRLGSPFRRQLEGLSGLEREKRVEELEEMGRGAQERELAELRTLELTRKTAATRQAWIREQAAAVMKNVGKLEQPGGLVMSPYETEGQWDFPYAWAPTQLVAIEGMRKTIESL